MALLVSVFVSIVTINKNKTSAATERTRSILAGDVDVQCALDSTFESYEMYTLDDQIQFTGSISIDKNLDADYNALSDYDDSYDVTISANYDYDRYVMYISYFVYDDDELIAIGTINRFKRGTIGETRLVDDINVMQMDGCHITASGERASLQSNNGIRQIHFTFCTPPRTTDEFRFITIIKDAIFNLKIRRAAFKVYVVASHERVIPYVFKRCGKNNGFYTLAIPKRIAVD